MVRSRALLFPGPRPLIMGILNVTPDSFSDGGRYTRVGAALRRAREMVEQGASIIDVGGESTRPGAAPVPADEELRRVVPVVKALSRLGAAAISVDTSKAVVAREAVAAGAGMVNDVTALRGDPAMAAVVARARVPVVLMHMRGTPRTMQRAPRYRDVTREVCAFLGRARDAALRAGIARELVWLDPGLGFGKTLAHNLLLLRHLDRLTALGAPLLIGPSRKAFLGRLLAADVHERLAGTLACVAVAAEANAAAVRVHDVAPVREFLTVWRAIHDASRRQH